MMSTTKKNMANKAFKTDSQRMAFPAYFGLSVYVTMV
ncbi:hypothetical protein VSVS12_04069 [Vibrio scophthalmi]|nr:hypothetical protein VSVS12_04069 [Vibrio scophthalmi]